MTSWARSRAWNLELVAPMSALTVCMVITSLAGISSFDSPYCAVGPDFITHDNARNRVK
jgi:hypothetical protein